MRKYLSYANVMATAAVFIALGGSSYAAVSLARNSVGSKQIRRGSVGASEIHTGAVSARDIRNGSIRLRDLSRTAQEGIKGPPGPIGPVGAPGPATAPYFSSVGPAGQRLSGSATTGYIGNGNAYRLDFSRSLDGCAATATVATAAPEGAQDTGGGYATVGRQGNELVIRTYAADGTPKAQPFNVLMAC
ncbi:MAG TPA: hypothetical protein VF533_07695 [Solirubrobacteraceae bacterium]|jgi:hypothetical protein